MHALDLSFDSDSDDENIQFLVCVALHEYCNTYLQPRPCRTSILQGHDYVLEILNGHERRSKENFRMEPDVFINLCEALKVYGKLEHSRYLTVQEQVCIFLLTIGHNERNRVVQERFQHSGQTISKYFNRVLKAVCRLGKQVIRPPDFDEVPAEIRHNPRFYPFFKDCVGAIDGTHISARVPASEQIPYRGKHTVTTQNVMCVCSFDMRFTYVLAGWEGTANDSRVFIETVHDPTNLFPIPPTDKYYVVDSGYTNMPGFLSPYRGERYHLNEFRNQRRQPRNKKQMFNYRHSSLRNVIERCFGVLKARFPILRDMPPYSTKTQRYIPIACCTIHNWIRTHSQNDTLFAEWANPDRVVEDDGPSGGDSSSSTHAGSSSQQPIDLDISQPQLRHMSDVRNQIAGQIWESLGNN
ncbi:hypothetical protein CsSME_00024379 [Camellia sinensis var. sinensis]